MSDWYGALWLAMAGGALWLLYRIFQLLKSIHYMVGKWFDRDYIAPFERAHGIYDDDE